jgi:hypothetical protein
VPNVEWSVDELTVLHEALARFLELGMNGGAENGKGLTSHETIRQCQALHQRVHRILTFGLGSHLPRHPEPVLVANRAARVARSSPLAPSRPGTGS